MIILIRNLCLILVCVLATSGTPAAAISPQQLMPQGSSEAPAPNQDSTVTTLPPNATPPQTQQPDGTVVIVPPATVAPPSTTVIAPPATQEQQQVILVPTMPETPSTVVIPVPPPTTVVVPEPAVQEPPVTKTDIPEEPKEKKPLTPADFLPKTPTKQDKDKKAEKAKPAQPEPKSPLAAKKGDALKIPPDAGKTKDLSFLEGCWVGTRPEYRSKRIVTERFCFGKNGTGKRYIEDPGVAGSCVGATKAVINSGGVLRMMSDRMFCAPSGSIWNASEMTCQGEGSRTPCTWVFDAKNKQSYTINFVRE